MAGRTPARSRSAWNRWDSDPAVTDDLEAIELAGGPLGDVGVERQTTFFDEMRQARVARVGLIDRRTQEGSSRLHALLYACYPRLVNGYKVR